MKNALVFLVLLFTTCTCFARMRGILVQVTANKGNPPTVSIYSSFKNEQCIDVSIAEAVTVLERVQQPGDGLNVSVLVEGRIEDKSLWQLLDGLKNNSWASLVYLETNFFPKLGPGSKKAQELQVTFKTPEHTKNASP